MYSKKEIDKMIEDIEIYKEKIAKGVVFGILMINSQLILKNVKSLCHCVMGYQQLFIWHSINVKILLNLMRKIIDLGFDRILTSGGKNNVMDGIEFIEKLVDKSDDMISIMPGSKLRSSNIELFLKNNRIRDFHSSCYINENFH